MEFNRHVEVLANYEVPKLGAENRLAPLLMQAFHDARGSN